ncbi:MAG: hypothetical protein RL662_1193 [Bacteroidota bacterium]|jgi:uncharacterized protein (TIRG00374 family)
MSTEQTEEVIKKGSPLTKIVKTIVPFVFGLLILWMLYRKTDFAEMWATIKDANFAILLFSLIFGLLGNIIRGLRWKLLIEPLGYNPNTLNLVYAVLGNYAVNLIFPRAGEVWRCGVIAKKEKIPFVRLIGTLLLDRVFDTIMVILITLAACCFNLDFFLSYIQNNEALSQMVHNILYSKWMYISLGILMLGFFLVFSVFKNTTPIIKTKKFFKELGADMKSVWQMKKKQRFLVYTVSIWACYFLYFYITFFAFDFTKELGFTAGLIAFAISSLSMAIPTNGGMGVWHAAVVVSLGLYGVTKPSAEAFAFGVFAIQNFWIVLYGVFGFVAISLRKK